MPINIRHIFKTDLDNLGDNPLILNVYNLVNVATGKYLGAAASSAQPVIARDYGNTNDTQWTFTKTYSGFYNIDSLDNGVLRATGLNFPLGAWLIVSTNKEPINLDSDKNFQLEYDDTDDTWRIRVSDSSMYVYHDTDGNFYSKSELYVGDDAKWKLVKVADRDYWWSKDKIDKINLNFSLLSGGGMAGPLGTLGVDGNLGDDGPQGPQGPQGNQGSQGSQGPQGISSWTEGSNDDFLTLFPNFQGDVEYQPIRVGLGQTDNEQEAINYQGPLHILHNHDASLSNLVINSPNSLDFHFKLSIDGTSKKLELGKLDNTPNNLILQYDLDTMDYILHDEPDVESNYLLEASRAEYNPLISYSYNLVNVVTGKYLGAADTSKEPVIARDYGDTNYTQWRFSETSPGFYNIDSLNNGVLRATGPDFSDPWVVVSTNFEPINVDSDKEFKLEYDETDDTWRIRVSNMFMYHDVNNKFYVSGQSSVGDRNKWKLIRVSELDVNNNTNLKFRSTNSNLGNTDDTKTTIAEADFKYTTNAIEKRILTSLDTDGNAVWKNKAEVFGTLPVGSIISITEDWFNDDNFYLTYTEDQTDEIQDQGFGGELDIIYGRGREDSPFEGWYICNGQTWTDGVIQYEVPNLNSFDFNVDGNSGEQEPAPGGDNTPIIIGGYNFKMESNYNTSNNEYTSEFVEPTSATIDQITLNTAGSDYYVSRNVHIVYLKEINYYWRTGDITPVVTTEILLSGPNNSSEDACRGTDTTYKWTGGTTDWVNGDMSGILLYKNDLSRALTGWYSKEALSRYWNGSSFTNSEACLQLHVIDLSTSSDVIALNGTLSGGSEYSIDTPSFENATILLNNNTNASIGWYRENGTNGLRRYWDGTQFLGERFNLPYIHKAGVIGASTSSSIPACQSSDPTPIYYLTNDSNPVGITELHKINESFGIILVHLNWNGNQSTGDKPLVKIYSQNAPGISGKYLSLTDIDDNGYATYRAPISTTSELINKPTICKSYEFIGSSNANGFKIEPLSLGFTASGVNVSYLPASIEFKVYSGTGFRCGDVSASFYVGGEYIITLTASEGEEATHTHVFNQTGTYTLGIYGPDGILDNIDWGCGDADSYISIR